MVLFRLQLKFIIHSEMRKPCSRFLYSIIFCCESWIKVKINDQYKKREDALCDISHLKLRICFTLAFICIVIELMLFKCILLIHSNLFPPLRNSHRAVVFKFGCSGLRILVWPVGPMHLSLTVIGVKIICLFMITFISLLHHS